MNNETVTGADAWRSVIQIPGTHDKLAINYTYYITKQQNDTITHRIDFSVPGTSKIKPGSILYGNFTPQHDLDTFRQTFMPPAECLSHHTIYCPQEKVEEWDKMYFSRN